MELLFARLPPPLRRTATRRVAAFLLESTLSSVGAEASVLCNAVAWADPEVRRRVCLWACCWWRGAAGRGQGSAASSLAGGVLL
jgi:hypothetical protein